MFSKHLIGISFLLVSIVLCGESHLRTCQKVLYNVLTVFSKKRFRVKLYAVYGLVAVLQSHYYPIVRKGGNL